MHYYNDNDPKACAWLRELISAGHLPPGDVDERSILDVEPSDLTGYTQCHFFAGIGGWPLALRWSGLEDRSGIWSGSCPCQPLSCAGKRQGHADERHLWPAFHRLIAECRPATMFGEQVASKDGREWFAGVRLDLEDLGYACGGADLCAAGLGAPHRRQRLFWVAHTNGRHQDHGELQRGREHGQRSPHGGVVRVADAEHAERRPERTEHRETHWRNRPGRSIATCSVADAKCGEDHQEHPRPATDERERTADMPCRCRALGGVGDAAGDDEPREWQSGENDGRQGEIGRPGAWSDCDILPCRDGKARRVEAGTFPLADGIPGRMGLLRGYGNAIVPQVAEVFVRAWMEIESNPKPEAP